MSVASLPCPHGAPFQSTRSRSSPKTACPFTVLPNDVGYATFSDMAMERLFFSLSPSGHPFSHAHAGPSSWRVCLLTLLDPPQLTPLESFDAFGLAGPTRLLTFFQLSHRPYCCRPLYLSPPLSLSPFTISISLSLLPSRASGFSFFLLRLHSRVCIPSTPVCTDTRAVFLRMSFTILVPPSRFPWDLVDCS